ncbi:gfo/Idh/MocA family oxidoreductase [Candidatus Parcubacteria bacterium]|nr:MAG: gfo/Idh/MocA family oxidoreductase [Candidatus Parcubacteria bacterium]
MSFRTALIGCGSIGSRYDEKENNGAIYTHAGLVSTTEGLELVALCDVDSVRLQAAGKYWNVNAIYTEVEKMLEVERPEVICVATPDDTHTELLRMILHKATPRLVFTEKPLASTLSDAVALVSAFENAGVILLVDHVRRYDANHRTIRLALSKGELGPVQGINGCYVRGLLHNGCQMINTLRFLFGPVEGVQALGVDGRGSLPGDPSLSFALQMVSGPLAVCRGMDQEGMAWSIFEIDIFGLGGRLRLIEGGFKTEYFSVQSSSLFPNFSLLVPTKSNWQKFTYGSALRRAGKQMVRVLAQGNDNVDNLATTTLEDLAVVEAVRRSAQEGNRFIAINPSEYKR